MRIRVLGLAGENLVADDDDAGGFRHNGTDFIRKSRLCQPSDALQIELAAAHEEMAFGIGTDEAAFAVDELRAADGAKLPPLIRFFFRRLRLCHRWSLEEAGSDQLPCKRICRR
jgi:hypothetical protein